MQKWACLQVIGRCETIHDEDASAGHSGTRVACTQFGSPTQRRTLLWKYINDAFLNGRRLNADLIPDGSHPCAKGYAAWARAMEPKIAELLGDTPIKPE